MAHTTTGTIKSIKADKGFGFILADGTPQEYFFHVSALVGSRIDELQIGDRVEFQPTTGPKGPRAEQIERI